MLDDYEKKQPLFCNYIKKIIKNNKLNHAYLIETNGVSYSFSIALSLAKTFLCPKNYTNDKKCSSCFNCINIEQGNYPDLIVIEPDGKFIKKEQLLALQDAFKVKPLYGKYLIYIIKDASLLNSSSSNTILKFLEEPSENIIAILLTDNIYNCMDTIVSRCQILSLTKEEQINKKIYQLYCPKDMELEQYIKQENDNILNFYSQVEENKTLAIALDDIYNFKEKINLLLNVGLYLYTDVLNIKLGRNSVFFKEYENQIKKISKNLTIDDIIKKIDIINQFLENSNFNVNRDLFIDNFVIKFTGGIYEKSNWN